MSKAIVESFIFKVFIALLIFDAVSVVYMTPKVEPVVPPTQETKETQQQQDQETKQASDNNIDGAEDDSDPFRNSKSDDITGTLVIQHCSSHQAALDNIKTYINGAYPSVVFESSIYPLSPVKALISKFLQYIHWIMLALNLFGDKIFGFLQMPYPSWYLLMKEKKMIVLGVVMLGSMFLGNMVNKTDAFEVYLNGDLISSKLQSGNIITTSQIEGFLMK